LQIIFQLTLGKANTKLQNVDQNFIRNSKNSGIRKEDYLLIYKRIYIYVIIFLSNN